MGCTLSEFVHNKFCTIIPINTELYDADTHNTGGQVNLHIETDGLGKGAGASVVNYKAAVIYLL